MTRPFLRKNVVSAVIVTVILVLILYSFVSFVFLVELTKSVKENKFRYERADKSNQEYISQIELKGDLSRVLKDVNYTTLLTLDCLTQNDEEKKLKRTKVWAKRITPVLDTLDLIIDKSTSDYMKFNFNKMYDEINKNKFLQQQLIDQQLPFESIDQQEVNLLKRSAEKLSEQYSSFVSSKSELEIYRFESVSVFEDNTVRLIGFALVVLVLMVLIVNLLINYLTDPIKKISRYLTELKEGDFPGELQVVLEDYQEMTKGLDAVTTKLKQIQIFAESVADVTPKDMAKVEFQREGTLGVALVEMQAKLEQIAIEDKRRNHINQGLERFSEILSNYTSDLERFGDVVLKELVGFLKANQGAFYVVDEGQQVLKMTSCYAYQKKKYLDLSIQLGQGLIGQVWQEAKPIYLTEVPKDYVTITSGLGESTPRSILVVPLIFNEQVQGIVELASFNGLEKYELDFVGKVSESISAALSSVKINTRTQHLLMESSNLAQKMKIQEDMMRSNVEELNQVQEESKEREAYFLREIARLKKRVQTYERNL